MGFFCFLFLFLFLFFASVLIPVFHIRAFDNVDFQTLEYFKTMGKKNSTVLTFAWKTVVKEIDFAKHFLPGELSLSMYLHIEHYFPVQWW